MFVRNYNKDGEKINRTRFIPASPFHLSFVGVQMKPIFKKRNLHFLLSGVVADLTKAPCIFPPHQHTRRWCHMGNDQR